MKATSIFFLILFSAACTSEVTPKVPIKESIDTLVSIPIDTFAASPSMSLKEEQICNWTQLAEQFDIKATFKRFVVDDTKSNFFSIEIILKEKIGKKIVDSLIFQPDYLAEDVFSTCKDIMSYTTSFNRHKDCSDNDYGTVIIADFNFDELEDIAIVYNSGGYRGVAYNYFIQKENKQFILDDFLTETMVYFPSEINFSNKTLVNTTVLGACYIGENTFQLKQNNRWIEKSNRSINICEGE